MNPAQVGNSAPPGDPGYLATLAAFLPRLFRYHLARSGDPAQAQWLTERTIQLARRWQPGYHPEEYSPEAWFLGMARYVHSTSRRGWKPPSPGLTPENPTPLANLAKLAQLAILLDRLPPETADALALTIFAGLTPDEAGEILGVNESRVRQLVKSGLYRLFQPPQGHSSSRITLPRLSQPEQAGFEWVEAESSSGLPPILPDLADSIQPDPDWLTSAQALALAGEPRSLPRSFLWLAGSPFRWLPIFRNINLWLRLLPIVLVCALALAWWFGSRPAPLPPAAEPEPAESFTFANTWNSILNTGYLVPPDASVCQYWQAAFASQSTRQVNLTMPAAYQDLAADPLNATSAQISQGSGTGCEIEVSNPEMVYPNFDGIQPYLGLLKAGGFQVTSQCGTGMESNCSQALWRGYTLQNGSLQAILSYDSGVTGVPTCPPGDKCPTTTEPGPPVLRLLIGSDVRTVLEPFLNAWIRGDTTTLDFLAPDLRQGISSINALDRRVGIVRSPSMTLLLTWSMTENAGDHLRVTVQEQVDAGKAYLFQIILTHLDHQWKVTAIAPGIIFPLSSDMVYWGGQDGAVYRYSLANNSLQAITSAGIYSPRREHQPESILPTPPEISPDGRWLTLYQFDATLLVSLQGDSRVVRLPITPSLAWTRDGSRIAFASWASSEEDILTLAAPFTDIPSTFTHLAGTVVALAWSPDGSQLAVLAVRPFSASVGGQTSGESSAPAVEVRDVFLIDGKSEKVTPLAALSCPATLAPNPFDLAWTADGQEIWYRSMQVAIWLQDGAVMPLVYNLGSGATEALQDSVLFPKVPASGLAPDTRVPYYAVSADLVSPDGHMLVANPAAASPWYVNRISVAHVESENAELWTVYPKNNVYSLAWTQDSQNLVAGEGHEYQAGRIFRLDAVNDETQTLANDVFWIGVASDLQARGLAQAPESEVDLVPADPTDPSRWDCLPLGAATGCFDLPRDWSHAAPPGNDSAAEHFWFITNLAFHQPVGWASVGKGGVYIEIDKPPEPGGQSTLEILQGLPLSLAGNPWVPVSVNGFTPSGPTQSGIIGVRVLSLTDPAQSDVFLSTTMGQMQIHFYVGLDGGFDNPVIQKIMNSSWFF